MEEFIKEELVKLEKEQKEIEINYHRVTGAILELKILLDKKKDGNK